MNRSEKLTEWIQESIDRGATTVEEIHKIIADFPLKVLERNGLFEQTASEVQKVQDQSIGVVYDSIREINKQIGELASELLKQRNADRN